MERNSIRERKEGASLFRVLFLAVLIGAGALYNYTLSRKLDVVLDRIDVVSGKIDVVSRKIDELYVHYDHPEVFLIPMIEKVMKTVLSESTRLHERVEAAENKTVVAIAEGTKEVKTKFSVLFLSEESLRVAAREGAIDEVKFLIKHGVDVNCKNGDNVTPLHEAAGNGRYDVVDLLLKNGAEVNSVDWRGWTSLHWAANWKYEKVADLLIRKGADRQIKAKPDHEGNSHRACDIWKRGGGNLEFTKVLC